jgi:hypothetical protein
VLVRRLSALPSPDFHQSLSPLISEGCLLDEYGPNN